MLDYIWFLLVMFFASTQKNETYEYKLDPNRSSRYLKSGYVTTEVDFKEVDHEEYVKAYKVNVIVEINTIINKKIKERDVFIPVSLLEPSFLKYLEQVEDVFFESFSLHHVKTIGDCNQIQITDFKENDLNLKDVIVDATICPYIKGVNVKSFDVRGRAKRVRFQVGFDLKS